VPEYWFSRAGWILWIAAKFVNTKKLVVPGPRCPAPSARTLVLAAKADQGDGNKSGCSQVSGTSLILIRPLAIRFGLADICANSFAKMNELWFRQLWSVSTCRGSQTTKRPHSLRRCRRIVLSRHLMLDAPRALAAQIQRVGPATIGLPGARVTFKADV